MIEAKMMPKPVELSEPISGHEAHTYPNASGSSRASDLSSERWPPSSKDSNSSFVRLPYLRLQDDALPVGRQISLDPLSNPDELESLAENDLSEVENDLSEEKFRFLEESVVACTTSQVKKPVDGFSVKTQEYRNTLQEQRSSSRIENQLPTESPLITVPRNKSEDALKDNGKKDAADRSEHEPVAKIWRRSTDQTAQSSTFEEELLFLKSDEVMKKIRQGIEQCKDIKVALKVFEDSQNDRKNDARECHAVHEQVTNLATTLSRIRRSTETYSNQKKLAKFIVSELQLVTLCLQKSLGMLETEFGLHDIRVMNKKSQGEAWDEMLLKFQEHNSCSISEHLQITDRFGKELLTNLRHARLSSDESNLLKTQIHELNNLRLNGSLSNLSMHGPISELTLGNSPHSPEDNVIRGPTGGTGSYRASESNDSDFQRSVEKVSDWASQQNEESPFASFEEPSQWAKEQDSSDPSETASTDSSELNEESISSFSAASSKVLRAGEVKWLWICQTDLIPGYFATPWKDLFSEAVCIGAISVVLRALDAFTDSSTRKYVSANEHGLNWIRAGKTTYPSYAINAMGGIVIAGTYQPVEFEMFSQRIPPIELLHSYEHQVNRKFHQDTQTVMDNLAELMGLDCWLSFCGRLPEIYDGPSNLLRHLPALVQHIMSDFEFEFANLDRTSNNGGFQIIQDIADSLIGALKKQNLIDPEQLFALVALLRAAKMALCVIHGTDTKNLRDVFLHDVQVYLA